MDNPTYTPTTIVAISIVLPLIAVVAVCLRFWVRTSYQPTYLGVDDWLAFAAVIFCLADGANLATAAIVGTQGRIWTPAEPPPDRLTAEAKSDYAQVILEKPFYALIKLSVLFFYRRIFHVHEKFRLINNGMIALVICWCVAYTLTEIFVCGAHPNHTWDPSVPATCVNQTWLDLSFAITDTIGDILVVSMPYHCIKQLQMGRREKWGIAAIFLLGTLSTAASIVRLGFIAEAFTHDFGPDGNANGSGTPPSVWSTIEGAVGVLAACLPPLGPLIRKGPNPKRTITSIKHMFSSSVHSTRKTSTGTVEDQEKVNMSRPSEYSQNHHHEEEPHRFV